MRQMRQKRQRQRYHRHSYHCLASRRLAAVLVLALAAVLAVGAPAEAAGSARPGARGDIASTLDAIVADPRLAGAHAGVVVRAADTGRVVYDREGDRRMVPASNQKLLTSAAALEVLGADYRFTTEVLASGDRAGSELHGDLYLRGTGDPSMQVDDYARLAAAVANRGIRTVRGSVVADDTWYDAVRLGDDWAWDDEQYGYAAPISALTVAPEANAEPGSILVEVRPGSAPGRAAVVGTVPATDQVRVVNRATTGAAGTARTVQVERAHGTNTIVVSGTIPAGAASYTAQRSTADPTSLAAEVFAEALAEHGVSVVEDVERSVTPEAARPLVEHESAPLAELLVPMMKLSLNGYAESLVKAMGRAAHKEGTAETGLEAMTAALVVIGVDAAELRAADGSGLSRKNLVAADQLAELLIEVRDEAWFGEWEAALPVAAAPERLVGGTLRDRMEGTPAAGNVRAKTGSLTGVSALSGYVRGTDGQRMVFSVIFNNYLGDAPKDIEDEIAVALAAGTMGSVPAV